MKMTYSMEDMDEGKFVIHIYISDTTKRTEKQILKKIPIAMNEIKEQKKVNKRIKKFLKPVYEYKIKVKVTVYSFMN